MSSLCLIVFCFHLHDPCVQLWQVFFNQEQGHNPYFVKVKPSQQKDQVLLGDVCSKTKTMSKVYAKCAEGRKKKQTKPLDQAILIL